MGRLFVGLMSSGVVKEIARLPKSQRHRRVILQKWRLCDFAASARHTGKPQLLRLRHQKKLPKQSQRKKPSGAL